MRIRIGTRRSRLALAQASEVAELLGGSGHEAELVPMTTAGDRGAPAEASPQGTKGLFVAEITEALLAGGVDLAVHSAKDLPSDDPEGVVVAAVPRRSLPYDVLVTATAGFDEEGTVGTSSLRRQAQLLRAYPSARVVPFRGNVDTRLRKLRQGEVDAVVLAAAGLDRLGVRPAHAEPIPVDVMVPAPGQGALAVQARAEDPVAEAVATLDHASTRRAFEVERALVGALGGGCRLPLGAYAEARSGTLRLLAVVARPDGSELLRAEVEGDDPGEVAAHAAEQLRAAGADAILREAS
ncbi:MAG TPA: hydroxymethylbilane synthase [Actinomycetota bacterium]